MWVLAIVNEKGGSAKTTTAVNLAAALAERNRRVLVVNLDAQANASLWLGVEDDGQALLEVLLGERPIDEAIRPAPELEGVDVLPASRRLGNLAAHVGWAELPRRCCASALLQCVSGTTTPCSTARGPSIC